MRKNINLQEGRQTYRGWTVMRDSTGTWAITDPSGITTTADHILTGADITRLIDSEEEIRRLQ